MLACILLAGLQLAEAGVQLGGAKPSLRVNLQAALYTTAYRQHLELALCQFAEFLGGTDLPPLCQLVRKPDRLSRALAEYVQYLYDKVAPQQRATHAILAVQRRWPHCRRRLTLAWESITSWRLQMPSQPRRPISKGIMEAVVAVIWARAFRAGGHEATRLWVAGALIWLAFDTLLRPGEMLGLRPRHLNFGRKLGLGPPVLVLTIENPKNKRFMGRRQFVVAYDVRLIEWVMWILDSLERNDVLLMGGRAAIVRIWCQALDLLGIPASMFTLGSLRTGGATEHFLVHANFARLQYLGRWRNPHTLEHYLQEAVSALSDISLPQTTTAGIDAARGIFTSIPGPPPSPWWTLGSRRGHSWTIVEESS